MVKNYLEEYKEAVKSQYEIEKNGNHSAFFIKLTRTNLRKLCVEIFKNNNNLDDLKSFSSFFGFDFDPTNTYKLKREAETNKFRAIEKFFKGETDLTDVEGVNIAAILVNFKNRPYLKYSKLCDQNQDKLNIENIETKSETLEPTEMAVALKQSEEEENKLEIPSINTVPPKINTKNKFYKRYLLITLILMMLSFSIYKITTAHKDCMEWKNDRYIEVDSNTGTNDSINQGTKIPYDESLLKIRKITPVDTTTYFKNGKATIWYCKDSEGNLELFNAPGYHPITNKPLRPITDYIIEKYIEK